MASAQGIRAGRAYVELFADDSRLVRGLRRAEQKLKAFGAGITAVGMRLTALGVGVVTPFLGAAKVFADVGSDLVDMSQRTGLSVESLSELGFAAEQSGADMETLETGLRKMQKLIVDAAGGSKEARMALAKLGLTVADLAGLSPEQQFKLLAERLSKVQNPTLRAALAMDVLGKSGTKLLPLMANGAKGIEALQEEARRLGLTISTEDATAAEAFGDTLSALWKVLKVAAFTIGSALAPALSDIAQWIMRAVKIASDWIKENKDLIATVFKIAAAVLGAGVALVILGGIVSGVGAAFGVIATVVTGVGAALGILGSILGALLSPIGLVIAGVTALAGYLLYSTGAGGEALAWLGERFDMLKGTALAAWQGISDALAAGDLGLAAKIAWLSLRMVWLQGITWLEEKWIGFKAFFVEAFHSAVFAIAGFLNDAWAGMQIAWAETVAFLGTSWSAFIGLLKKGWLHFSGFFQKVWARIKSVFSDTDADEEIAKINADIAQRDEALEAEFAQKRQEREQARQQRRQEIEQDRAGIGGELGRMQARERAEREAARRADLEESEEAVTQAEAEWRAALAEAAQKRAALAGGGPEPLKKARSQLDNVDALVDTGREKTDVQGTFNALLAGQLGAESWGERTANASEQIAEGVKRLNQKADQGGLVFT